MILSRITASASFRAKQWRSRLKEARAGRRLSNSGGWTTSRGGHPICVDAEDQRARKLVAQGGAADKAAARVWRRLAVAEPPDVVVDVGANYGEIAFAATYGPECRIHLVEANPTLWPFLRRTSKRSPYTVQIHEGAASSNSGQSTFYIATKHSGLSSLSPREQRDDYREVTVPLFRLDERITLHPSDRLLFKVDVEGHERQAIEGMTGLFEQAASAVGLIEVIDKEGVDLSWLFAFFEVGLVHLSDGSVVPASKDEVSHHLQIRRNSGSEFGKDLVIWPRQRKPTQ